MDEIDSSHIVRQQAEQTAITSLIDRLQLLDRFTVGTLASSLSDFIVCVTCTHSLPWEGIIGYKYGAKVVKSYEMSKKNGEIFCEFRQYSVNIWYIRSSYGVPILTLSLSYDYPPIILRLWCDSNSEIIAGNKHTQK